MYIDTHAHLNYTDRYGDETELMRALKESGIAKVINVGWDYDSSAYAAEQSARHDFLWFAAGIHPSDVGKFKDGDLDRLSALLASPKGVAVGEIGLDYHYENTDKTAQMRAFTAQMELAYSLKLPFIIHSRDAAATLWIFSNRTAVCSHTVLSCTVFRAVKKRQKNIYGWVFISHSRAPLRSATQDDWTRLQKSFLPTVSLRRQILRILPPSPSAAR